MLFDNFKLSAFPLIQDIYCKECGSNLVEVTSANNLTYFYCGICKLIYKIELLKISKSKIEKNIVEKAHQIYLNTEKTKKNFNFRKVKEYIQDSKITEKERKAFKKFIKMLE
jgi:hypothetical protein